MLHENSKKICQKLVSENFHKVKAFLDEENGHCVSINTVEIGMRYKNFNINLASVLLQ